MASPGRILCMVLVAVGLLMEASPAAGAGETRICVTLLRGTVPDTTVFADLLSQELHRSTMGYYEASLFYSFENDIDGSLSRNYDELRMNFLSERINQQHCDYAGVVTRKQVYKKSLLSIVVMNAKGASDEVMIGNDDPGFDSKLVRTAASAILGLLNTVGLDLMGKRLY